MRVRSCLTYSANTGKLSVLLALGFIACSESLVARPVVDLGVVGGATGLSSGGVYSVEGTVGQASTVQVEGERYSLASGFWTQVLVVVTPGAPRLWVGWDTGSSRLRLTWQRPSEGWLLQSADVLEGSRTVWTSLEGPYESTDTELGWTVLPVPGRRFYRLQKSSLP